MPLDSSSASSALTRRARRAVAAPETEAVVEAAARPLTRAELRRRAAQTSVVAAAIAPKAPDDGLAVAAPSSPRRARSHATPGEVVSPTVAFVADEPVIDAEPVTVDATDTTVSVEETTTVGAIPADTGLVDLPVVDTAVNASVDESGADVDEFVAAAKLFSFTGETPVQPERGNDAEVDEREPVHVARRSARRSRGTSFRRMAATSFSVGVMGVVGLLAVGLTTPTQAVAAATNPAAVSGTVAGDVATRVGGIQAYVASDQVQNVALQRNETYSTTTVAQLAADSGISRFSNFFVNNPNSPIQWPFAVGVPISYGFGMRDGTMHEGVDFTPGEGAPIQAIADGTVRIATESGGAFGVTVVIDHQVDGQLVSSRYGHMLYGSLKVKVGEHVKVGTVIGNTGNTGRSFGAHTHVEILLNGTTPIDPLPWLRSHAGG